MQASICTYSVQFENVHHFEISNLHASLQIITGGIVHFENPHAVWFIQHDSLSTCLQPVYTKQEV